MKLIEKKCGFLCFENITRLVLMAATIGYPSYLQYYILEKLALGAMPVISHRDSFSSRGWVAALSNHGAKFSNHRRLTEITKEKRN